jgi:alkanesulfonate monooxygenase SsuD/methylene tetrahydromethanopterin reductase-like flavin-dependent oxidoreductase (luciferase family)
MKIGLMLGNQYTLDESMANRIDGAVEQARLARDLGFDLIALGQHHLATPYQQPSSVPFLARLAAETGSMRIGVLVFLLPLHNPVDLAEQIATLDAISHGRMIVGVGLGYRPEECETFGIKMSERVPRMLEGLEVMRRLWTQEHVEFAGRFYSVPSSQSTIRTVQQPHPPIWMAANQDVAVRRVGKLGHTWIMNPHVTLDLLRQQVEVYRRSLDAAGHPFPSELPLLREAWVAPTREQAWAEAGPFLASKYQVYESWGQDKVVPADQHFARPLDDLARDRFIIGTPDDLLAEAHRYATELGATTLILRMQWAGMRQQDVLRTIRLIGEQVLPRLGAVTSGVDAA